MSRRGWHQTQLDKVHESLATHKADQLALAAIAAGTAGTVETPGSQAPSTGG